MSNYVLYPVLELQSFIIVSIVVLALFTLLTFYFMGRKKSGIKDFGMQALFFGLKRREQLLLVLHISQLCFVGSVLFFRPPAEAVQLVVLAFLCLLRGILEISPAGLLREVLYGGMMGTAMAVSNLLRDYMRETGVEFYMAVIWGLLCLFILQYSVYYFLKSLERMLQRHEKAGRERGRHAGA